MQQTRIQNSIRATAVHLSLLILISTASPSITVAETQAADTPAELQTMFDQGLYASLLTKLNVALAAKASDVDKNTRYKLLMLKGEALLRTKASEAAGDAFKAAALVGPDDNSIAMARADAALIKHSSAEKYQPKTKPAAGALPAPIDIVGPAGRKLAFAALFTDLMATAKPQVDKAEKLTTLPPILEVATQLADLRPVEIASTGSDTDSKELLKKLGDQASTLMTTALKDLDSQITTIGKQAAVRARQERVSARYNSDALLPEAIEGLDGIASQAKQIGTAAESMQAIFGDAESFNTIESDAKKTIDSVNKLLKQYKHPAVN